MPSTGDRLQSHLILVLMQLADSGHEVPLSTAGEVEAEAAAKYLHDETIDRVVSCPLNELTSPSWVFARLHLRCHVRNLVQTALRGAVKKSLGLCSVMMPSRKWTVGNGVVSPGRKSRPNFLVTVNGLILI